jgi:hypothetical protein
VNKGEGKPILLRFGCKSDDFYMANDQSAGCIPKRVSFKGKVPNNFPTDSWNYKKDFTTVKCSGGYGRKGGYPAYRKSP